jgi:hypothetical protein
MSKTSSESPFGHRADGGHRAVGLLGGGESFPRRFVEGGVGQAGVDDEEFAQQVPAGQVERVVQPGRQPGGEVVAQAGGAVLRVFRPSG